MLAVETTRGKTVSKKVVVARVAVVIVLAEEAVVLGDRQLELAERRPKGTDPLDTQMTASRLANWRYRERKVTFQNGTIVQPLTRVRVPRARLTAQVEESRRHPAPILKSGPGVKAARGDSNVLNVPTVSIRSPVYVADLHPFLLSLTQCNSRYEGLLAAPNAFMASVGLRKEKAQNDPNTSIVHPTTNVSNKEAAEYNVTTSMMITNKSTSKEKAAHKSNTAIDTSSVKTTTGVDKPAVSVNSRPKADLMDLDCDQQTTQPVLQFTAPKTGEQLSHPVVQASPSFEQHIEALEKRGVLSADQLEALKLIATQVRTREDAENLVKETPRQKTYTKSELVSLRPAAAPPNVTIGIAKKFAEQQKAFLIGEHVHKTRYHTAASLTEDFEKLSITDKKHVDKEPVNAPAKNLQDIGKSKINPFGPPPTNGKGPSLPAHLLNQTTTADHGAAARAQYSSSNDILAPVSTQQLPADVTSTARPTRRNMINQTGFIALAQNRVNAVAAGNKGENPLLVAREQGM